MQHFFVSPEQVKEEKIYVEGGDVNHMKNVLRMKTGEELTVNDGEAVSTCVQWNPMKQIWQCLRYWRKSRTRASLHQRSICSKDFQSRTRWN